MIQAVIDQLGIRKKLNRCEILDRWPGIVGTQIANVTTADHIEGDKLFVRVTLATWRNELVFLKQELIRRINEEMKEEIIQDIIFR